MMNFVDFQNEVVTDQEVVAKYELVNTVQCGQCHHKTTSNDFETDELVCPSCGVSDLKLVHVSTKYKVEPKDYSQQFTEKSEPRDYSQPSSEKDKRSISLPGSMHTPQGDSKIGVYDIPILFNYEKFFLALLSVGAIGGFLYIHYLLPYWIAKTINFGFLLVLNIIGIFLTEKLLRKLNGRNKTYLEKKIKENFLEKSFKCSEYDTQFPFVISFIIINGILVTLIFLVLMYFISPFIHNNLLLVIIFVLVFILISWIVGTVMVDKMEELLANSLKAPLFFIVTWREFFHSLLILAYLFLLNLGKSHKVLRLKVSYLQYFRVFLTLVGFTGVGILLFK